MQLLLVRSAPRPYLFHVLGGSSHTLGALQEPFHKHVPQDTTRVSGGVVWGGGRASGEVGLEVREGQGGAAGMKGSMMEGATQTEHMIGLVGVVRGKQKRGWGSAGIRVGGFTTGTCPQAGTLRYSYSRAV